VTLVFEHRKVEDLQFTAEEAAIDRSDLEVVLRYIYIRIHVSAM